MRHHCLLPLALILVGVLPAHAATPTAAPPARPNLDDGKPRMPPPEAFAACEGKKEGDTVSFTTPRGETRTGKCALLPAKLAAVPDHANGQPVGNPPPKP